MPIPHGAIHYNDTAQRADFLYRLSLKCLIYNHDGEVLVVKEAGRDWWDLPGGGMDHGEDIKTAIAREMKEEVNLKGDFTYKIIAVDEPGILTARNIWQVRLIFWLKPQSVPYSAGDDSDEVAFINPQLFKNSENSVERRIFTYHAATASLGFSQD